MQISNNISLTSNFATNNKKESEASTLKNLCLGCLIEHIDQFNLKGVLNDDMIQELLVHEKVYQVFEKIEFADLMEKIGQNNLESVVFKNFPFDSQDIRSFGYYFPKMKNMELVSCTFNNKDSENFKPIILACEKNEEKQSDGLSDITFLDLNPNQQVERKAINSFPTRLNPMSITNCEKIPDDIIFSFAEVCHELSHLDLSSRIEISGNAILALVKQNPHLAYIDLAYCQYINDDIVYALGQNCPDLIFIDLTGCGEISDQSLIALATHCPKLIDVNLTLCSKITDKGVIFLSEKCPDLKSLDLAWCDITDQSIYALIKNCPRLTDVSLWGCEEVTDEAIDLLDEVSRK